MRRIVTAAAVLGLLLGTVAGSPVAQAAAVPPVAQTAAVPPAPTVLWRACVDPTLQLVNASCGLLTVPLDHQHPSAGTIKIALSYVRHTVPDEQYQGIMLANPGGPGASGLKLAVLGLYVPGGAGRAYDWIGFDPRGVGASQPSLSCDSTYFGYRRPAYVPTTVALEAAWRARAAGYAASCAKAGGRLLDHLKTVDTVQDMESIRRAFGHRQISFYGYSYGSYLGQVYSTLHPTRVHRMVLDGNVDPRQVWYRANLAQDPAFDRNLKAFFGWVAAHDDLYHLGGTGAAVERLFYAQRAGLDRSPAAGVIGGDEWNDLFVTAGYSVLDWTRAATTFAGWVNGADAETLKWQYDATFPQTTGSDNRYAVYAAVQCTDAAWPRAFATVRRDSERHHAAAPFLTWYNTWYNAPCLTWPAKAGTPVPVDGRRVPPILLINETNDAATPFAGSLEVRGRFPAARLVEGVDATSHATSLSGVACVDNAVAAYLSTGALPPRAPGRTADLRCDPLPRPLTGARLAAPERTTLHRLVDLPVDAPR